MLKLAESVMLFHQKYGHPLFKMFGGGDKSNYNWTSRLLHSSTETHRLCSDDLDNFRLSLSLEEMQELVEALEKGDLVAYFDACLDSIYVMVGHMLSYGITPEQIDAGMREVCKSNLSKDPNGIEKPIKGKNFFEPDLRSILNG